MNPIRIAGINFDHFHMGDLLRMAHEHTDVEIVGICDDDLDRMAEAAKSFRIPETQIFTDHAKCLEQAKPDLVILCPAASHHGEWVEKVAPFGCDILVEKPFAASLAEADRMIQATNASGSRLAINWPLTWVPSHRTTKRLIDEGKIGEVQEVHHYGGNRGPLWHVADKVERSASEVEREKPNSWFYKQSHGGGSLLDYAGYGTTLGTWFMNGRRPIEVTCVVDQPQGLEVDEHSITIARYATGLSKFETRWGTFTDPWTHQPQPKCGFVVVGTEGTISSDDYAATIRVQSTSCPAGEEIAVDTLVAPLQNPVQYMVDVIRRGAQVEGPLSPEISRIGQQIVDSAVLSVKQRATVALLN
ncbi:putative oxidoreductase YteT precursor [Novipirellula galeiformis]|uniref:Putative oxidoreductase YteT n=1 Tax=Novipirellula galeiformis TaxID=2528004 RepID=A0A5C6CJ85_9BACT|nr:Gfo/Idh/MocA family oxidoreductase [Novipirellula galeiformis]TWU24412.1 putative oxidoreductase YteT precursor [Novipirellula galeiformis]